MKLHDEKLREIIKILNGESPGDNAIKVEYSYVCITFISKNPMR